MSLQDTLNSIKLDKDTNLKPENLKAGVTCLGVNGTLESGGSSDYNTKLVPTNGAITSYITEISKNLDTSKVTDMGDMFRDCRNLQTIPLLDTSNVTIMGSMFDGCRNLSDESLNNILAMCTNAAKITSNKTLKYIGLTEEQANICQSLSNYQDFINAGWTTGY